MTTFAQWGMERFCGLVAMRAHGRINTNVNIAINTLLAQQESALPFVLPLDNLGVKMRSTDDYTDTQLESGEAIADLLNDIITKVRRGNSAYDLHATLDAEDLAPVINIINSPFDGPFVLSDQASIASFRDTSAFKTTCTLAEKHKYKKMTEGQRKVAAEFIVCAEAIKPYLGIGAEHETAVRRKMFEIEISEREAITQLHVLPVHIRRKLTGWIQRSSSYSGCVPSNLGSLPVDGRILKSVRKYKVCKLVTSAVKQGAGRAWMTPERFVRITGKEQRRLTNTRSSSIISYQYKFSNLDGVRDQIGTALAEIEFFVSVDLPRGRVNGLPGSVDAEEIVDSVMLVYVRALPTTTLYGPFTSDCRLVRLTDPGAFHNDTGHHFFIECSQILDLAGLIRDRMDIFVVGRTSALNLSFTE